MNTKIFVEEFNKTFGHKVGTFPAEFCNAKLLEDGSLSIKIGPRDMHLGPKMEPWGSGSMVGTANKWIIKRKPDNPPPTVEKTVTDKA